MSKNKKYQLDEDEIELLESVENGEWVSVPQSQQQHYIEAAQNAFKKNKRINIRISDNDILALKVIAAQEGIPYQTLVSSILHKFISGRYIEKSIS